MIDATVELQTEILSACLLKDLRLLRMLINKLVSFVQDIIEKLPLLQFPMEVAFDKENSLQAKPLKDVNIKDTVIKIKNINILYAILNAQIQVFTYIFSHIGDSHSDIFAKVNELCIKIFVFKSTPMRMKIEVLNYFTKILKNNMKVTQEQLDQVVTIVNCFGNALGHKVIWSSANDDKYKWEEFYFSIKAFLKEIIKIKGSEEKNFVKAVAKGLTLWINNGCQCLLESNLHLWNVHQLILLAKKNLRKLNDDSVDQLLENEILIKFLNYLEFIPQLSSLFTLTMTHELQADQEKEFLPLFNKKLQDATQKTTSIHAFDSLEPFEATLTFWKEIFCLVQNTNELHISNTQTNFMKSHDKLPDQTDTFCFEEIKVLKPIFNTVITSLLNQITKTQLTLTSDFMAVILLDFAHAGLSSLSESNLISEELKLHLFYLLLAPFCKMGHSLSSKLPKNVAKVSNF